MTTALFIYEGGDWRSPLHTGEIQYVKRDPAGKHTEGVMVRVRLSFQTFYGIKKRRVVYSEKFPDDARSRKWIK